MPTFVHIADERDAQAIRRSGLTLPKQRWRADENACFKRGVFALPLIEDFMLSHQWVRELKRRGHRAAVGIYFWVPDDEPVWAGRYHESKVLIPARDAAARLRDERVWGYEVIIPRSIRAADIRTMRAVPAVGWRFFPEAKGSPPRCLCRFCCRGNIKSRAMRARLDPDGDYA